jgi:hypothetical protein
MGRLSKTAHFGRKSRLAFWISLKANLLWQRSVALAGHLAEIKRAGRFGSGVWCEKTDRSSEGLL